MTVNEALSIWPQLVAKSKRLGAPATAKSALTIGGWQDVFMGSSPKPKADIMAIHRYMAPSADGFLKHLDDVYAKYKLPIWVTEFAVADWESTQDVGGYAVDRVKQFMIDVCKGMDERSFVERYTWKTRTLDDPRLGTSSLFLETASEVNAGTNTAELTELGVIYSNI